MTVTMFSTIEMGPDWTKTLYSLFKTFAIININLMLTLLLPSNISFNEGYFISYKVKLLWPSQIKFD